MYKGTGASPGIALGKALLIEHSELVIEKKTIENIDEEIQTLKDEKFDLEIKRDKSQRFIYFFSNTLLG